MVYLLAQVCALITSLMKDLTTPGQLSVAVNAAALGAGTALAQLTVILAGQVIVGACVSITVIVNVQVAVLPAASVAVDVTVVAPTGKKLPDAGLLATVTPGQLSLTVGAAKVTTAPH